MSKKVLIAIPDSLIEKADRLAVSEARSRSGLIREALRRYVRFREREAEKAFVSKNNVVELVPEVAVEHQM